MKCSRDYPLAKADGIKSDNRLENLRLIRGRADHMSFNMLQRENKHLRRRVEQLENLLKM